MPTTTWYANKDARLALTGSTEMGAGASDYLPVGYWGGYRFRAVLDFNQTVSFSSMISISSAILHLKVTGQHYVGFSSDPDIEIRRVTGSWSEGSSSSLSTGNSVVYPGPATADFTAGPFDVSTSEGAWDTFDVTALIKSAKVDGWNGLKLYAVNESSGGDVTEFYSSETSFKPYLVVTYSTNTPPDAPTGLSVNVGGVWQTGAVTLQGAADVTSESGHAVTALPWPQLKFNHNDAQGNGMSSYAVHVSTSPTFSSFLYDSGWVSSSVTPVLHTPSMSSGVTPAPAMVRGTTYYWRCITRDTVQTTTAGDYSTGTNSFTANALPTASITSPVPSGFAEIYNLGTDTTAWSLAGNHARPRVKWFASETQTSFRVRLYQTTTLIYDSGARAEPSARQHDISVALLQNTEYGVTVQLRDSLGEWGVETAKVLFKVRWAQIRLEYVGGSTSSTAYYFTSGVVSNGTAAFFFATTGTSGGAVPTWYTSITSVAPNNFFSVMVRLAASTPGVSPTLASMTFTRTDAPALLPDHWLTWAEVGSGHLTLDKSIRRYGTQAPRMYVDALTTGLGRITLMPAPGKVPAVLADRQIAVQKSTKYVLSAYVQTRSASSSSSSITGSVVMDVYNSDNSALLIDGDRGVAVSGYHADFTPVGPADWTTPRGWTSDSGSDVLVQDGWLRLSLPFKTPPDTDFITVRIYLTTTVVGESFWIDAVKLEEGSVPTAWSPGFVADAVVLDAGGLTIDAEAGGIFRLLGSAGGVRDTVELGAHGLQFGTDVEVWSPSSEVLQIGDGTAVQVLKVGGDDTGTGGGRLELLGAPSYANVIFQNVGGGLTVTGTAKPVVRTYVGVGTTAQTSYTWTKPNGLSYIVVECQGGGAGSGGTTSTGATQVSCGGGGGGGGYARSVYTTAQLAASHTVRAGGGGAAGAASAGAGGAGGASDFGATGTALIGAVPTVGGGGNGGTGSGATTNTTTVLGGTGGTASGDVEVTGQAGGSASLVGGSRLGTAFGGGSHMGGGARSSFAALPGNAYGGGASGGTTDNSSSGGTGDPGGIGIVVITEYYL